jgi:anti-sigma regulatory factor (Ser/Thr protein kinase)
MHREWSAKAIPETVGAMRNGVTEFAKAAGVAGTPLDDVRACVSEAVTNAVVHAYRDGREPGEITMRAEITSSELKITVIDDGIGFLPRNDSPGLGLGIPTIAGLSTSMSLSRPAAGGTEVCMSFALHALG